MNFFKKLFCCVLRNKRKKKTVVKEYSPASALFTLEPTYTVKSPNFF